MTALSVNLNAVAMLRNRRDVGWPSVTGIARIVLDAGAHGVTVHPRPDERHIRTHDVYDLAGLLAAEYPDAEYNIEGYPDERFLKLVEEVRPDQVTLVPDDPAQSTSDHGWDVAGNESFLRTVIERLHRSGMRVSLFIDEDDQAPARAAMVGADRVELYTGPYGATFGTDEGKRHLSNLAATVAAARRANTNAKSGRQLGINIGHDLTLENLPALIGATGQVDEASIGQGITSDALIYGFAEAVRRYKAAMA
ncbi:MAG: pyridoxine 5'-phosphate synthase [Hyphomicrobiaceae bacterium]|nr:pyridoxine 5'-phosphate synthase [Hyphomicrobiaceae bacterium]